MKDDFIKKETKDIGPCMKEIRLEVASSLVNRRIEEVLRVFQSKATLPGYRPGKAPRDLIKKHFEKEILKEAVDGLLPEIYELAILETKIRPVRDGKFKDVNLAEDGTLSFRVVVEVRPKIALKNYKGLKVVRVRFKIEDKDVMHQMKKFQEVCRRFVDKEDKTVEKGDLVTLDAEIFINNQLISEGKKSFRMIVNEGGKTPEISKALIGTKVGQKKEVKSVIPDNFSLKEYAGREATFKIELTSVKKRVVPELDNAFAKSVGFKDFDDFRNNVREILQQRVREIEEDNLRDQLIAQLLQMVKFEVPESLVEEQTYYLVESAKDQLRREGVDDKEIAKKEKGLVEKLRPQARDIVRVIFIITEIAFKEGITVDDEEIDRFIGQVIKGGKESKKKIENLYKNKKLRFKIRYSLIERKVMDLLIQNAVITEEQKSLSLGKRT